jgi:hypothetical protein
MPEFDAEAFVVRLERLGVKLTAVPLADGKVRINRWRMLNAGDHAQQIEDLWNLQIGENQANVDLLAAYLVRNAPPVTAHRFTASRPEPPKTSPAPAPKTPIPTAPVASVAPPRPTAPLSSTIPAQPPFKPAAPIPITPQRAKPPVMPPPAVKAVPAPTAAYPARPLAGQSAPGPQRPNGNPQTPISPRPAGFATQRSTAPAIPQKIASPPPLGNGLHRAK